MNIITIMSKWFFKPGVAMGLLTFSTLNMAAPLTYTIFSHLDTPDKGCTGSFEEYGEAQCTSGEPATFMDVNVGTVNISRYSSICADDNEGVRKFCVLLYPKSNGNKYRVVLGGGNTPVADYYFIPYSDGPYTMNLNLKYGVGAVNVTLYSEKDRKGQLLGVFDVPEGGAEAVGSGAARAKSATVLGVGANQDLCFRTIKNSSYRCYHSKESESRTIMGRHINDLNTVEAPPGFELTYEGAFDNDLYRIDLSR